MMMDKLRWKRRRPKPGGNKMKGEGVVAVIKEGGHLLTFWSIHVIPPFAPIPSLQTPFLIYSPPIHYLLVFPHNFLIQNAIPLIICHLGLFSISFLNSIEPIFVDDFWVYFPLFCVFCFSLPPPRVALISVRHFMSIFPLQTFFFVLFANFPQLPFPQLITNFSLQFPFPLFLIFISPPHFPITGRK